MSFRFFSCEEVAKAVEGRILTWKEGSLVKNFTGAEDNITEGSLYFLYSYSVNEDNLLWKLQEVNATGIVINADKYNFNIEKWREAGLGIIEVSYLNRAYMGMARLFRSGADIPVIQVIGSSGKTTTKEMIGAVLEYSMPTLVGAANLNTSMGIASHIASLRDFHKAAVFEAGMNGKGIMKLSSSIARPDIAVVTCIHRAHFARMGGSLEAIIDAKSEILEYVNPYGYLIINGEDENCKRLPLENFKGYIRTFGFSRKCDIWASDLVTENFKTRFTAHVKDLEITCTINTVGKYNVGNALAAVLIGLIFGLKPDNIAEGLRNFNPYPNRLQIMKGIYNTTLVNDNFNANPDSTRMLLEEVPNLSEGGPVVLVMGDMENPKDEISDYARRVHFEIGEQIGRLKVEGLVAVGKWAGEYVRGAISTGMDIRNIFYFRNAEEAENRFLHCIIPGAVILFKGSMTYVDLTRLVNLIAEPGALSPFENSKINLKDEYNKTIVVDIDSVIADETNNIPLDKRAVLSGALHSLRHLKNMGYHIVLHTSRFEWQRDSTIAWLAVNDIPFDDIIFGKPRGIIYIDDRGYRFKNWKEFWEDVQI